MKVKILLVLAALLVGAFVIFGAVVLRGKSGITPVQAGTKLAASYNSKQTNGTQMSALKCRHANGSTYICAVIVVNTQGNSQCDVIVGTVTDKTAKIEQGVADPYTCAILL